MSRYPDPILTEFQMYYNNFINEKKNKEKNILRLKEDK